MEAQRKKGAGENKPGDHQESEELLLNSPMPAIVPTDMT